MNPTAIVEDIVAKQLKSKKDVPDFSVGDTVNVHVRIIEGDKERIQVYQGVLIARKGRGVNETITVRRIVANEGVERIFPLHSPRIAQIEIVRRGDARRAKLFYLRERTGKSRRLRDQRRGLKHVSDIVPGSESTEPANAEAAEKAGQTGE
jgi:large subunit ribosomal protein L19